MSDRVSESQGRVVKFPLAGLARAAGVAGRHEIWVPGSKADAAAAVARTQDRRTIGFGAADRRQAVSDLVYAPGAVVINLAQLNKIAATGGEVRAEVGIPDAAIWPAIWPSSISRFRSRIISIRVSPRR